MVMDTDCTGIYLLNSIVIGTDNNLIVVKDVSAFVFHVSLVLSSYLVIHLSGYILLSGYIILSGYILIFVIPFCLVISSYLVISFYLVTSSFLVVSFFSGQMHLTGFREIGFVFSSVNFVQYVLNLSKAEDFICFFLISFWSKF